MRRKYNILLLVVIWGGLIGCRTASPPANDNPQPANEQLVPALAMVEAIIVTPTASSDQAVDGPSDLVPVQRVGKDTVSQTLPERSESAVQPNADSISNARPDLDPNIASLLDEVSPEQLRLYVYLLEDFGTRNAFSDTASNTFGIGAARRWIYSEFERVGNGRLQVRFDDFDLNYLGLSAGQRNVVATLPGIDPESGVIIVMAHYDSRAEDETDGSTIAGGANDNGSGVALLLESARVLSSQGWNQTIIFLALAAEEQGGFGARHFARNAYQNNMGVLAAFNYDGVGGRAGIPQNVRLFAPEIDNSPSGKLGRYYEYIGGLYLPDFPVVLSDGLDREGRWGDQREFIQVGIPAVRVIESKEDPQLLNSSLDTWRLIDYSYLQKVTQLNVAVVANAANKK